MGRFFESGWVGLGKCLCPLPPFLKRWPGCRTYCGATNNCCKGALTPNWTVFVRTCVRASRWKILFTPYLVVQLSPSAKIRCVYVTSINGGTQILTFLKIHNNRDFQNSRFFCGNLGVGILRGGGAPNLENLIFHVSG